MNNWNPIETVPKDGRAVLLCWAVDADGDAINWNKEPESSGVFVQVASWSDVTNKWWVYIATPADAQLHFTPTHWMHLPNPPLQRPDEWPSCLPLPNVKAQR